MSDRSDILFVGWGGPEGVSHYRTILPARTMGAEWVIFGMDGKPMMSEGSNSHHRVIVVQNCWYEWQLRMIRAMKAKGSIILFNVDDWIKGIGRREQSHGNAKLFGSKDILDTHSKIWAECDGAIVSTEWIAQKVRGLVPRIAVARNGIDEKRYTPWMDVERDMGTIIGWAGGTGHTEALRAIAPAVSRVVNDHSDVSLWIVGQDESGLFDCPVHRVDWSDMHLYPAKLACFDINLAPAMDNDFYRGKSQLRLYEAMTLGTPSIVHPMYDEVGNAGLIARSLTDWEGQLRYLTDQHNGQERRAKISTEALRQAKEVTIDARIGEWTAAIDSLSS